MPMPESTTSKRICGLPTPMPSVAKSFACSRTKPSGVNLSAFHSRLSSTCWMRFESPTKAQPSSAVSMSSCKLRFFSAACSCSMEKVSSRQGRICRGLHSSCSCPASTRVRSRMSLIRLSSNMPELRACLTKRCISGTSFETEAICSMPSSPLRGVRISCDMHARKASLASLVFCSSRFLSCASITRLRASTSSPTHTAPTARPSLPYLGSADTCRWICRLCNCDTISRSKRSQRWPWMAAVSARRTASPPAFLVTQPSGTLLAVPEVSASSVSTERP
mmetsp:Transcript_52906/g.121438  ORF Transcript_52906/g.121438 Transcript_52906/m.121438 type:complete len:278 (+) Transcript_52906:842-1675(+)